MGDPRTLNPYSYAANNPLTFTDENGLCFGEAQVICPWQDWSPGALSGAANFINLGDRSWFAEIVGQSDPHSITAVGSPCYPQNCPTQARAWRADTVLAAHLLKGGGWDLNAVPWHADQRSLLWGLWEQFPGVRGWVYDSEQRQGASDLLSYIVGGGAVVAGVHGNSLLSTRVTYLYQLLSKVNGAHLKWGMSSDLGARYSSAFMEDKFFRIVTSASRAEMAALERMLVEHFPGPLNFEKWAGSKNFMWGSTQLR